VKPLACLAALDSGVIDLGTHFTCTGALFGANSKSFRCWADINGVRNQHGSLDVVGAIKHSCNIFMYHVGELVGIPRLTEHFQYAGFGELSGTGLIEETKGINPTTEWLAKQEREAGTGLARQLAIGQADVSISVVQAANLMALYASGVRRQITLVKELRHDEVWPLPSRPAYWDAIREGMYEVVNDTDGTAYKYAYMPPNQGYVLCGKTGSAQAVPWPVSYSVPYVDNDEKERVAIIQASTRDDAIDEFVRQYGDSSAFEDSDISIHERWPSHPPDAGPMHSHAWFAGFLQAVDATGRPDWAAPPRVAFAVLVEFGGSGGRTSGPLAHDVAETLLDVLGPQLDASAPPAPAGKPKATARTAADHASRSEESAQ
jgi:cell division protein FtsI/penicillin-binding protein 2